MGGAPPGTSRVSIDPKAASEKPEELLGTAASLVSETNTKISIKGKWGDKSAHTYVKHELAKLEGCKVGDRCWAVGVSVKPFPQNLVFCNHKGKPGHGPHGRMHTFKPGFSARVQRRPFREP